MSMTLRALPVLVLSLLAGTAAHASTIVAPGAYAAAAGNGTLNTAINLSTRTYEMQIAASQLGGIAVGDTLNGLSWRLDSSTTSASGVRDWADFEITLGQAANTIAGMSSNFADNLLNPVLVHDGAFSYDLGGFGTSGSPKPFAPLIGFSTLYTYTGGDLVVLISHTAASGGDNIFLDALSSAASGYGTDFRAMSAATYQSTTATTPSQNFTITQFDFGAPAAVPEPGSLALFGVGLASLIARRRKAA